MENSLEQLKTSLKEMFQFQNNDLNFWIYKIYKLKQKEIENFIDEKLETIVKNELQNINNLEEKQNKLEIELFFKQFNQEKLLENIDENFEKIEWTINLYWNWKTEKLKEILKSMRNWTIEWDLENKIYNYILNFFELYYSEWDFWYNSRSLSTYKVEYDEDYNWSDIMFHWKHKWSYYIKTANGFNSIKCELQNKKIEFLLETNEESEWEEIAQNNNKETDFKHYNFSRIEKIWENSYKVIFNLSKKSTLKEDIFKAIFTEIFEIDIDNKFLFNKEWKAIFKSLEKEFWKIENGNIKWFGQLKIKKEDLLKKYNENVSKTEKINKTFDELDENNEIEKILIILWSLDNKLNSFYIWNDSDYFIHKDLKWFLVKEKEKFIKNNILWDLNTILNSKIDDTTLVIAKTFNEISSKIIDFLSAIEEFQKWIFEMKKKVLVNEYCITLDKIDENFYKEILENKAQIEEWKNLGFIEDEKVLNLDYLKNNQTLNIDTKFYSQDFKDKLLGSIENLEEQTNWILINSENFQALNLLKNKYRWKIKCIYIDPPYNTWWDFLYKDSFKQSSWLSMMYDRINLSKDLITNDWWLFCFIDENSKYILKGLLDYFLEFKQDFVWNYKTIKNMPWKIVKRQYDDIFLYSKNSEYETNYLYEQYWIKYFSEFFKEYIDDDSIELSIDDWYTAIYTDNFLKKYEDKIKTTSNFLRDTHKEYISKLKNNKYWSKFIEDYENYLWEKIKEKVNFFRRRDWYIQPLFKKWELIWNKLNAVIYEQTIVEKRDEETLLPNWQKPQRLLKKLFEITKYDKGDIILDYFAWSWTTCVVAHKMWRKYIWIEMWEYFDSLVLPRMKKVLFWETSWISNFDDINWKWWWIIKYQVFEQYEDILDKLEVDSESFPKLLDLKYLYKKEEIKLKSTLNLRKPFENNYIYWKAKIEAKIDLIETYNYLKWNSIQNIRSYIFDKKYYKCVKIWNILQIWRNIEVGENDLEKIKEILKKYDDIEVLEFNSEIYSLQRDKFWQLEFDGKKFDVEIIDESIFCE